ncbi:MAG: poly-gamma-glutamate hydrolase family protein [Ilumatobacteraceae bacterium]|nr:poly-gamma-glutamate hydrolase family protein [Ilumatobacteraceae bacterium]
MAPTDGLERAATLTELLETDGVVEQCVIRSGSRGRLGVMAYHGGSLEEMTDVIGERAAERSGASYYAIVQPSTSRRHLASTKVRPAESPALTRFVDAVDVVVTVHGFGRRGMFSSLLLGGGNREFAEHVGTALRRTLPAYDIVTDLERIPVALRGIHPDNPVNLPPARGVQMELPPRVRGSSPMWWDWEGPGLTPHTEGLIDGLVDALTSWA